MTTAVAQSAQDTRKQLLRELQWDRPESYSHVLASARGKGGFWILREIHKRDEDTNLLVTYTTATFIKMDSGRGVTYFNEIDIDNHPLYYSCPMAWLTKIQPQCPGGEEWKERAAAYHTGMIAITPGLPFTIDGTTYTVEKFQKGKIWIVRAPNGKQFRASTMRIRNALMA